MMLVNTCCLRTLSPGVRLLRLAIVTPAVARVAHVQVVQTVRQ